MSALGRHEMMRCGRHFVTYFFWISTESPLLHRLAYRLLTAN